MPFRYKEAVVDPPEEMEETIIGEYDDNDKLNEVRDMEIEVKKMVVKEIGLKANKIRGLMAEKEISQEMLADALGLSVTSLNLKLQGKRQFKANEISRIARFFEVEVGFLFE